MKPIRMLCFAGALLLAFSPLVNSPARAAEKSGRLAPALQPFVDSHTLAGAVMLVANRDKVLDVEIVGWSDVPMQKPMRADDLFWIASMSKAMTAAGIMALVDDGKVSLDDPIEKFLPEFRALMVNTETSKDRLILKKPVRAVTVRHVLSHTSGMPFKAAIEDPTLDIYTLRERAISYAMTPLVSQPGEKYLYSNAGINTAGAIIEVVSGMTYEAFMDQRLLKPLGMKDTTFWPTEAQLRRLAKTYTANGAKTDLQESNITQLRYPLNDRKNRTPMPAGGYFSTAADVAKFCQMLLNGGQHRGKRVLSEPSVKAMTSVQSGEAKLNNRVANYGLGLNITTQAPSQPGELGLGSAAHGGAYKTGMWVDPQKGLVLVLMMQHIGFPGTNGAKITPTFVKTALEEFGRK